MQIPQNNETRKVLRPFIKDFIAEIRQWTCDYRGDADEVLAEIEATLENAIDEIDTYMRCPHKKTKPQ